MEIKYCDTCGKRTEKLYTVHIPVGAEQILRAGMSSYCQFVDGKIEPVMGRSDTDHVCISCITAIEVNNAKFINDLKNINVDALDKVKILFSGEK